jgi:hypothetical protein
MNILLEILGVFRGYLTGHPGISTIFDYSVYSLKGIALVCILKCIIFMINLKK